MGTAEFNIIFIIIIINPRYNINYLQSFNGEKYVAINTDISFFNDYNYRYQHVKNVCKENLKNNSYS